jgi:hypothetical protein
MSITFESFTDHGHYYGRPGHVVTIKDGSYTIEANSDLRETEGLVALYREDDNSVAGGDVMVAILQEQTQALELLKLRLDTAIASTGSLEVVEGELYVRWRFDPEAPELKDFLKEALKIEGNLETAIRLRHGYDTPMTFQAEDAWTYRSWSGTLIVNSGVHVCRDDQGSFTQNPSWVFVAVPIDRVVHEDRTIGRHFSLLAAN